MLAKPTFCGLEIFVQFHIRVSTTVSQKSHLKGYYIFTSKNVFEIVFNRSSNFVFTDV